MNEETPRPKKKKRRKKTSTTSPKITNVKTHASDIPSVLEVKNKRPDMYYRWVSNKDNKVEQRKDMGFEVVNGDMQEKAMCHEGTVRSTNDLTLMIAPLAIAKARQKMTQERANRRLLGAENPAGMDEGSVKHFRGTLQELENDGNL
jgi:hypothetical protein